MEKSDSITKIADALCKFQGSMNGIKKDASNPFFKSRYASLGAIIEDTREPLSKNGLSYAQFPTGEYGLETILMHTSGEWIKARYDMKPVDQKPQSLGSALTYQRRYALCAILGLQVEDDDANEASKPKTVQYDAPKTAPMPIMPVEKPVAKKDPYKGAMESIDATENMEQLNTVLAQVSKSVKLTADQKEALYAVGSEQEDKFLLDLTK